MNDEIHEQAFTLLSDTEAIKAVFNDEDHAEYATSLDALFAIAASIERLSLVVNFLAELSTTQNEILLQLSKTNANGLSGVGAAIAESHGY